MKKFFYILAVIIISTSLAACGTNKSSNTKTNSTTSKITYTKEITYFPSYNEAKSTEYTPASKTNPFSTAKYTIKNTTDTKVYEDYESMLKQDGWTITKGQKYFGISAKKDTHMANILIQKANKDVILVIISK